jgi:uncharacterized repeat protein (TIGR01451 family)
MTYHHKNKAFTIWVLVFSMLLSFAVHAKSPAAGTLIQNQASATYKDADGVEQTATSNVVETLIQQVGAMELVQDQTRYGAAGNVVYLPHVLTNTGNGVDTYDLTVDNIVSDDYDFDLTKVLIYADKDKDGLPDSTTPITVTDALAADESFYFVIGAEIPAGATNAQQGQLTIEGKSQFDATQKEINTDTIIVSEDAVINVVKSMSANSGASPSGVYTITLSYENKGVETATNVELTDNLPEGMNYNADSGRWSETGSALVLTDANNSDAQGVAPNTVIYFVDTINTRHKVFATIAEVAAGDSGEITFEVNIPSGLPASTLINIAEFAYNNGTSIIPSTPTNQVPFEILQQPGVIANGSATNPADFADNKTPNTGTDSFVVDTASRGATVVFDNIIRNTGNIDDVFDITMDEANSSFPTGTVFQLFQSDGFTPLMDSNNGTVDTGIMAPNASYKVVLKAILPVDASGNNAGNGFDITKTATSSIDSSIANTVTDHLGEITGDSVDLTNNKDIASGAGAADGVGIGPEGSAVTTENIVPGGQAVFKLFINNTSDASGSYELQYSVKKPFEAGVVEAGWKIALHHDGGNADCSTLGAASSSTNSIAAGASQQMCALVPAPVNAIADGIEHPVYFKVYSRLTGAFDIKHDAVMVVEQPALSMAPDQTGQVEPGGSVVYPHRITNNGNTALECIIVTSVDLDPQSGWSSVLYKDVNEDGQLDAGDTPLGNQTLAAGQSFPILIKLFAPATAAMGVKNNQTLTVTGHQDDGDGNPATCTGAQLTDQVQDVTTVSTSKMSIIKEQAVDALCDGSADGAFSTTAFQVQPGACVVYRLTATNTGATEVKNARIDDAAPTFTQFFGVPTVSDGNIVGAVVGTDGDISGGSVNGANISVAPGDALVLTFGVKLD